MYSYLDLYNFIVRVETVTDYSRLHNHIERLGVGESVCENFKLSKNTTAKKPEFLARKEFWRKLSRSRENIVIILRAGKILHF